MIKRRCRTAIAAIAFVAAAGTQMLSYGATAVERHGALRTEGGYILNKNGNIVQLRGMSFYWSTEAWNGYKYYNDATVKALVDTWKCTVVRAAYDRNEGNNSGWAGVQAVIDAAIKYGIYVIIDWHSHTAEAQESAAIQFFKEQATKYKNTPNVIFEPYNEPINGAGVAELGTQAAAVTTWKKIKPYLQNVTQAIRDAGAQNLVIAGTPYFCQYVNVAAGDQLKDKSGKEFTNLAYAFHFYAASHGPEAIYKQNGENAGGMEAEYLQGALGKIPLFVSEWGTTHSNGGRDGKTLLDEKNTNWWFDRYINADYHLGSAAWSASDFEGSSNFAGSASSPSASGQIVMKILKADPIDEYLLPSKAGIDGPAKGTVVAMPITHPAAKFMKYYGANINLVNTAVPFNSRDKIDVRTAANTCIPVLAGAAGDWVSYDIKNSAATKYLQVRYRPTSATSEGSIAIKVDDKSVGTVAVKDTGWQTAKFDTDVASGTHTITFTFTVTKGDGFMVEWLELTNTITALVKNDVGRSAAKTNGVIAITSGNNSFSVQLPLNSGFSTYRLLQADGRTVQHGVVTSGVHFEGLSAGVWFVELSGTAGKKQLRTLVCNQ